MLTEAQRDIIKSTVPLLEAKGEKLIEHFYKHLLSEYPQVRSMFNQGHQANGTQQRALANGVLMYARNIDRLEALGPLANQIVNKHVSLQVQPEHYPIVGTCLLQAVSAVLGTAVATHAVLDAWAAAYQQLANILIDAEKTVYDSLAQATGGWLGGREFRVTHKVQESAEIVSLYMEPVDGKPALRYKPGQYIGLRLVVEGEEIRRNYSLSTAPNGRFYRISVKREPGGKASNFLHDHVTEGDTLSVFPPSGEFTLTESDRPLVLISGGVGITPTIAIAEASLNASRPITFIHYARNAKVHAFGNVVDAWVKCYPQVQAFFAYEQNDPTATRQPNAIGRPSLSQLRDWLPRNKDFDVYFLGPKPFMAFIKTALNNIGVPNESLRFEFFGPTETLG